MAGGHDHGKDRRLRQRPANLLAARRSCRLAHEIRWAEQPRHRNAQKAIEMLSAAGFGPIETARVDGDIVNAYYICHRERAPAA